MNIKKQYRRTSKIDCVRRRGAAVVELAVCLPVIALIVMGSLAATSMIFLRTAAVQSAYETIREAVKTKGDVDNALEKGRAVLEFRNIVPESVTFSPNNVELQDPGTPITVTVRVRSDENGFFTFGPFRDQIVEVQATMVKE